MSTKLRFFVVGLTLGTGLLPLSAQQSGPKKYALLIGINAYEKTELKSLQFCENDVTELGELLEKAGFKRVVVMTQTIGAKEARYLPLANNIRKELKGLLDHRREQDTVLVGFAGHGVQFKGKPQAYFCPMDARLSDNNTLISLDEVYDLLGKCPARVKLLLADACRNDPQTSFARSRQEVDLESVSRPQLPRPPRGVAALFSCSGGQKSYESPELKHGIFFYHVLLGLEGKAANKRGQVTIGSLAEYVGDEVLEYVQKEFGADIVQRPAYRGELEGAVTLLTAVIPSSRTAAVTQQAISHFQTGSYALALEQFKEILSKNPKDADALCYLGKAYEDGLKVKVDDAEAVKLYRQAAELGSPVGMLHLAGMYRGGKGLKQDDKEAAKLLRQAAERGLARAMLVLGMDYQMGRGLAKDEAEAARWFRKALDPVRKDAELGNPESMTLLAGMYYGGNGVRKDVEKSLAWYKKAADRGHLPAMMELAAMYGAGSGVRKDTEKSLVWFKKAADSGHSPAMMQLANMYYYAWGGVDKDQTEALRWYRKAAEADTPRAMAMLGDCYYYGNGTPKDEAEAARWRHKAAEAGDTVAMVALGTSTKDLSDRARWFRKAAEGGYAYAMERLGEMYEKGEGVSKDTALAAKWYRGAVDGGNVYFPARYLARIYENGRGVPRNLPEAFKLYLKASEAGNSGAMAAVGRMYRDGRGVAKDEREAVKWFLKAVDRDQREAMNAMGDAYYYGKGVDKNKSEAANWYRRGAERFHDRAAYNLAFMYRDGDGVEKDLEKAVYWFDKSYLPDGLYNAGWHYENGVGVSANVYIAVARYAWGAGLGHVECERALSRIEGTTGDDRLRDLIPKLRAIKYRPSQEDDN